MADPTDPNPPQPIDPAVQQSYDQFNVTSDRTQQNMTALQTMFNGAGSALKSLAEQFVAAGGKLENIGNVSSQDAAKFGALTTAILGAKEAFTSFNDVDVAKLSTFTSQLGDMQAMLQRSPAFGLAKAAFEAASKAAKELIGSTDAAKRALGAKLLSDATDAFSEAKNKIIETSKAMLVSADNSLRFQNAMIQLAAQAGDTEALFNGLSDTFDGVGDDLSNLNQVTAQLQNVMFDAMQATGIESEEVMSKLMGTIMKMPGGINELRGSMEIGGRSTNILTAAVQYATGAGRDQTQVLQDMKKATAAYGISLQDALKFTANVTAVSNSLGAQIEDVHSALMASADAFKGFVMGEENAKKMTQGMTESMNQYVGALKNVGVPVQNALEMFKNYTDQVKNMNQAQQAFVSGMSGGPGGLMGGFQIDKLIKEGKFDELQKKVGDTIKRMTGPIVSFEDATKSQTAAAQYTRQIQILQQGPLGGMAKSREQAESLLEAMRTGGRTERVKDSSTVLSEQIEKGAKIEQLSYTELKDINISTKRMAAQAGLANLTTLQRGFAARTGAAGGTDNEGRAINAANQDRLRAAQERGMAPPEGSPTSRALKELGVVVTELPMSIQDSLKSLQEAATSGNKETMAQAQARLSKSIQDWKEQSKSLPTEQRQAAERIMGSIQAAANKGVAAAASNTTGLFKLPPATGTPAPPSGTEGTTGRTPQVPPPPPGSFTPAHKQVAAAVPTGTGNTTGATAPGNRATPGGTGAANNQPVPVTLAPGTTLTVNFNGTCPHCGERIQQNQHAKTNSAPSTA